MKSLVNPSNKSYSLCVWAAAFAFVWTSPAVAAEMSVAAVSLSALQDEMGRNPAARRSQSPSAIENLASLETVEGFIVDENTYDVIIFGKKGEGTLSPDDLAVALRCAARSAQSPGVTIDPRPKSKDPYAVQDVKFFGGVADTDFGYNLFDADYFMKKISAGLADIKLKNFQTYRDLAAARVKENMTLCSGAWPPGESLNRFWFFPSDIRVSKSTDGVYLLDSCEVALLTEKQFMDKDKKEILSLVGETDDDASAFAAAFTARYPEFVRAYPVYRRLKALFGLYAAAKFMAEERIPADFGYILDEYKIKKRTSPKTVPGVRVSDEFSHVWSDDTHTNTCKHRHEISGGVLIDVDISAANTGSVAAPKAAAIKNIAVPAASSDVSRKPADKNTYYIASGNHRPGDIIEGIAARRLAASFSPAPTDGPDAHLTGDAVEMTVSNPTPETQVYKIARGTVLKNESSFSRDCAVYSLKGEITGPGRYITADEIKLAPGETKKFLLEVYDLGFRNKPSRAAARLFVSDGNLPSVGKLFDSQGFRKHRVVSKQIAVWAAVDGDVARDIAGRYDFGQADFDAARMALEEAGLKKAARALR